MEMFMCMYEDMLEFLHKKVRLGEVVDMFYCFILTALFWMVYLLCVIYLFTYLNYAVGVGRSRKDKKQLATLWFLSDDCSREMYEITCEVDGLIINESGSVVHRNHIKSLNF